MVGFLKRTINDFPEAISGRATSPAAEHLFMVREDGSRKLLDEERARAFHHAVAQLLFVTTRCCRDIQMAISFLTTRVRAPNVDDWGKRKRLLKYIHGTMYLPLTLEGSDLNFIRWWVDAAFAVHWDFWSHSGAVMMLGKGMIMGGSKKQKINTRSSTEAEIIGVDNYAGPILWTNYFMEAQGFKPNKTVIYQDN